MSDNDDLKDELGIQPNRYQLALQKLHRAADTVGLYGDGEEDAPPSKEVAIQCDYDLKREFGDCASAPPENEWQFIKSVADFEFWHGSDDVAKNEAGRPLDTRGQPMSLDSDKIAFLEDINTNFSGFHPATLEAYEKIMENPEKFGVEVEDNNFVESLVYGENDFSRLPTSSV